MDGETVTEFTYCQGIVTELLLSLILLHVCVSLALTKTCDFESAKVLGVFQILGFVTRGGKLRKVGFGMHLLEGIDLRDFVSIPGIRSILTRSNIVQSRLTQESNA